MTNVKPLWYVTAWAFPIMTAIVAAAGFAVVLVACFLAWSWVPITKIDWTDFRVVLVISVFVTFCFLRDAGKKGGRKEWDQAVADKHT